MLIISKTNKKNRYLKVKDFSAYLYMGRFKYLRSLKFFLRYNLNYPGSHISEAQNAHPELLSGVFVGQ